MRRVAILCVLFALWRSTRAEPLVVVCLADDENEIQDLIYLGASAPIFVRLRIRIDGDGFFARRRAYAAQLFDKLDTSGDGILKGAEVATIPPTGHLIPVGDRNSTTSVQGIDPPDVDKNGQVSRDELTTYILAASGVPFQIYTESRQPVDAQPVPLFERLDSNHDKQLASGELSQAVRCLRSLDMDLDGRIASDEIYFSDDDGNVPQNSNSVTSEVLAVLALFETINRNHVDDSLIRKVIQKYDKLARDPSNRRFTKDGRLNSAELGVEPEVVTISDENNDGLLDPKELRSFLTNLQPEFEILIEFGSELSGSRIELLKRGDLPQSAPLGIDTNKEEDVIVRLGRTHFELTVKPHPGAAVLDRLSVDFKNLDLDRNDALDLDEFGQIDGLTASQFRFVDSDGNEKVVEKELTSFINQQSELQKHVVSLELDGGGRSMFTAIDSSGDGRLDPHEMSKLKSRILDMDGNKDGVVTEDELPNGFRIVFSRADGR